MTTTTTTSSTTKDVNMAQRQQHEQNTNIEKQIQKQMGCMAGFFHLFHRHHYLSGKRLPCPSPTVEDSKSETEAETDSETTKMVPEQITPIENPTKSPLLPVFELKQGTRSSWKFAKEAPRLSLDSRAVVDAKGTLHPRDIRTKAGADDDDDDNCDKQRRSTSVIARLMGLDTLRSDQDLGVDDVSDEKAPQLRRSASESRVNKECFNYQFIDPSSFKVKQSQKQQERSAAGSERRNVDLLGCNVRNVRGKHNVWKGGGILQRKSYFDSGDFFPEPKQQCVSLYSEIEKRLKMRGIDEPSSKDLESLKHILEALQLKGLLHSRGNPRSLNFVYEKDESPIVVMKPSRNKSPVRNAGVRRNPDPKNSRGRTNSPTRSESNVRTDSPTIRQRRPLSVETQRRLKEMTEQKQRRSSSPTAVRSPRISSPRRIGQQDHQNQISSRSPWQRSPRAQISSKINNEKLVISSATEDESSTLSDSVSSCSQTDTERLSKAEEHRDGRSLLERCDKLLHSIAEMSSTEMQPSPVSVLDSSFYNDESSPSPVMKRSLEFKELPVELDDDIWSPTKREDNKEDGDYAYILEVLRAWKYLPEDLDVFSLLEKQQHIKGRDTSKVSKLERKLIFDTIDEILDRKRQLPPWKRGVSGMANSSPVEQIWSEFQKIRERDTSEQDLLEVICGVLKKDLAGDASSGWGECHMEISEAVLDIERLIFKDLIGDAIQDLAAISMNCHKVSAPCRKLVF